MGVRHGLVGLVALAVVVNAPLLGMTTTAGAKPGLHRSIRSDVVDDTWTASEAPVPANAWAQDQRVYITGTACPGPGSCIAVGYYNTQNGSLGLIDTISDGTSTLTEAPVPPRGHGGSLTGITCSSVAFCVAIGNYGDDLGLIDTLSDGTWTATAAPLPPDVPGGSGVPLSAVTCPADGSCVVIGEANFYNPDLETVPFIDTLSSGKWTATDAPLPANAVADYEYNGPTSVSCPAAGSCVAVGTYNYDTSDRAGLIDTLSDGTWTAQEAPAPPSTAADQYINIDSVACPALGWCEAIAESFTGGDEQDGLIESLSGGSWTEVQAPTPAYAPSNTADLAALACPAVGSCEIVGAMVAGVEDESGSTLAEDLSGGTWTPTSPSDGGGGSLACPAVGSCVNVFGNTVSTLSDGVWTSAPVPVPANAGVEPYPNDSQWPDASVWSVSCATIDTCAAQGQYSVPEPGMPGFDEPETLIETLGLGDAQTPVISSTDDAAFTVGQSSSFTVTAAGPSTPALTEKGKLPKGLRFASGPGTATITGAPSKKTGNYSLIITATATSTNERIGQRFLVTVNP
jgi:hypothetical protein